MTSLKIQIKEINIAYDEKLLAFSKENFEHTYAHLNTPENMKLYLESEFTEEAFAQELANPDCAFYTAMDGDQLVGYYKLNFNEAQSEPDYPNSAELARIYVHPDYKGQHIGKQMIRHALQEAKNRQTDYLWLGVWEKNMAARSFYAQLGFEPIGDHVFYLGNDAQRDLILKRGLYPLD